CERPRLRARAPRRRAAARAPAARAASAGLQFGRAYACLGCGVLAFEQFAQSLVSTRELRLREARRAAHEPPDLRVRITFDVVQPHDGSRDVGNAIERALERHLVVDETAAVLCDGLVDLG